MNYHERRAAGIAIRLLYLAILTAMLIVGGFIFIENRELHKVLAPSTMACAGILLGQGLAITGANYLLALRGRNLVGPVPELCFVLGSMLVLVAFQGPVMFQKQVGISEAPWWKPWRGDHATYGNQSLFYWLLLPASLLIISGFVGAAGAFSRRGGSEP